MLPNASRLALLAVLAAFSPLARALDLSVDVTTDYRIENTLVAYHSSDPFDEGAALMGAFDPGTYHYDVTIDGTMDDYRDYSYTLAATYLDPQGVEGVVIGLRPDVARTSVGLSFAEVFPGRTSEARLVELIKGSASGDWMDAFMLRDFFTRHLDVLPLWQSGGTLVGFSRARTVGSVGISAAPVPEPASLAAVSVGLLALRRRRK